MPQDTPLESLGEALATSPTGEALPLAPPFHSDGESESEAPEEPRKVISSVNSQRRAELDFRTWREDVSLLEFGERGSALLEQLAHPPGDQQLDIDISIDGCRTLSVHETVAEGIQHSVDRVMRKAGGKRWIEPKDAPQESEDTPSGKRQRGMEVPTLADGSPCDESSVRLRYQKLAMRTVSGQLVMQEEKKSLAMKRTWRDILKHGGSLMLRNNALGGDALSAHQRSSRRLEDGLSVRMGANPTQVCPNDIVITVNAYSTQGSREQEFDILASQPLSALRDAFYFVSDFMFDGPRRLSSACFFIDGIFYVDRRDDSALDYSEGLIPWIKSSRPNMLRSNEAMSMETRLCDLERIPLGERCVYIHQGDIEHNVIFSSVRLLNTSQDCLFVEAYPVLTYMRRFTKQKCLACMVTAAIWIILDAMRCPHNPCFMCAKCFKHFFQDADGEFLPPVDYKIFPYLHDE